MNNLLTVRDVAKTLNLHRYTILGYIRTGKLRAVKFGRVYRVRSADLDIFIDSLST